MSQISWQATAFLKKSSFKPIQYTVLSLFALLIIGFIFASQYEIDQRFVIYGEVVSKSGDREVTVNRDGIIELKKLEIGQVVKENEPLGFVKIQFTDHQKVSELLLKFHNLYEYISKQSTAKLLDWPELNSENPFISEQLVKSKSGIDDYNNEIRSKIRLSDLKIRNLIAKRAKLEKRVQILSNSKNRSLTEGLIDEQKREIIEATEEIVKIENENFVKTSEIRSQLLSNIKNSYLRIYEFKENHIIKAFSPGRISKILTSQSQQVKKDQTILILSPVEQEFELKLNIPTFDAGKIAEDQLIRAEVDSFPYQKFGMFTGKVLRIDKIVTFHNSETYFNAYSTIILPENGNRRTASSIQLLPGMKVRVHVIQKRVTLTNLLYEKLFVPYGNI